jgi:dihydropyrimidinase
MDLIIKNGTLITASDIFSGDVVINEGKIVEVTPAFTGEAERIINATGRYVFPGFIDVHTHLELPINAQISSRDDFYTGTVAAAFGGTTSIVDFIVPYPDQKLIEALELWNSKACDKAIIDYGFHMTISTPKDEIIKDIPLLAERGVTSIKCFTAYLGKYMMTDDMLFKTFEFCKNAEIFPTMHCENGFLLDLLIKRFLTEGKMAPVYHPQTRPPFLEAESIGRAIEIAHYIDLPVYIAHLSTAEGLYKIKKARDKSWQVYTETCPQYLFLDDTVFQSGELEASKYICSPPIRSIDNLEPLWKGLFDGDIEVFATDHCPFDLEKDRKPNLADFTKIPNGLPGIEDRVNLLFSEGVIKRGLDLKRFISLVSTSPAQLFGMYPQKGTLFAGSDADIVIYDPHKEWVISAKDHHQNVDYNVYEGKKVTGKPDIVISRGEVIIENDQLNANKGRGKFIHRTKSCIYDV